jgi:MFS family permease
MTTVTHRRERPRLSLIPQLPRPAWIVLGGDFASAIGSGLTLPCLFIYAHQVRQLSFGMAGLVVATVALASLVGNPAGGAAADRWTPRRALIAGLVTSSVGCVALALARSEAELFGAAALAGFGFAVIWPAQDTLLATLAGPEHRSAVFSVRHATLNAGLGLGALTSAAILSISHPVTFTIVFLGDAASYLFFVPILARLRLPRADQTDQADQADQADPPQQEQPKPARSGFRQVLADRAFVWVWLLTALVVTISFGQYQASLAGYATRPGGVSIHALSLAYAANTITVVAAQLFVLRWLGGRRRTTAAALAACAWALTWTVVVVAGHLGSGIAAAAALIAVGIVFAVGETLLSPTFPAIINDLAPPDAAGRYNGLGILAYTTGFLVGPAIGGWALGAGFGPGLFIVLIAVCLAAAVLALRLGQLLPPAANHIPPATPPARDDPAGS